MEDIANGDQSVFGEKSVDDYCKVVMGAIRNCQKSSTDLQGWYHYGDYTGVQKTMSRVNFLLHKVISKVYSHQDININLQGHKLQEQFDVLREGNDALLERINAEVDDASGLRRNPDIEMFDATVRTIRAPTVEESGRATVLLAARNVQKPQMFFEKKVNNSMKEPYIPILTEKPNSLKPLAILPCINEDGREFYSHPYEYELQRWNPPETAFKSKEAEKPMFMPDTPFLFVNTEQALTTMVEDLRVMTEISVDVEHHSYRTYLGLTCIFQVSSRTKDYIVDTLALRGKLTPLNDIFANPKITKVLHGADYDILWLQRDCGLYVVNMFDTHQASIILDLPHRSLGALLNKYCDIHANKTYQRADWRIRPLPEDFIAYARQDSHYLLYIFDILRNALIEKGNEMHNLIIACYARSTELCMQRYEKPYVGQDSHLPLYRKSRKYFNSRQLHALKDLYLWRDKVAREQDESVDYILPKHMIMQISEVLPKEMQGILACCKPIPIHVKTDQLTLHQIIRNAREQPLVELPAELEHNLHAARGNTEEEDLAHMLFSKHDLSMVEDSSSVGLSTLLNPQETLMGDLFSGNHVNISTKTQTTLFGSKGFQTSVHKCLYKKTPDFQSPFERYLLYLKMQPEIAAEDEKERQQRKEKDDDRIQKLRQHFLSLSKETVIVDSPDCQSMDSEQARIDRLMQHISSIRQTVSEEPQDERPQKKKKEPFRREPMWDKIRAIRQEATQETKSQEYEQGNDDFREVAQKKSKKKGKKRKSDVYQEQETTLERSQEEEIKTEGYEQENDEDFRVHINKKKGNKKGKKRKSDVDQETECNDTSVEQSEAMPSPLVPGKKKKKQKNNVETKTEKESEQDLKVESPTTKKKNRGKKRKSEEALGSPKKIKKNMEDVKVEHQLEEGEIDETSGNTGETSTEQVEPFDYASADYNMFKRKDKRGQSRKVKEKFKGKGSQKSTGLKKSGFKSGTWGDGKNNTKK